MPKQEHNMIKLKDLLNEGKKSKNVEGVRYVMAIHNNTKDIIDLVIDEKKDPKEVMGAFGTPLLNAIKAVLKHNYKPHPADSSNADKLEEFLSEIKKYEKIVELLIKRPSKAGIKRLELAWRHIWNQKGGGRIGLNGQGPHRDTIIESSLNESYYKTASEAADAARKYAEKKGYTIDEDDWQSQIAMGGRYSRLRPGKGKTHEFSIKLLKNGKPQKKMLQISLYGMASGHFELTNYIN